MSVHNEASRVLTLCSRNRKIFAPDPYLRCSRNSMQDCEDFR